LREHLVNVKKTRLSVLLREGLLDERTHRTLNEQLDEELAGLHVEGQH
jgi:hypothetical protein